jgi:hypothetical protein
MFEVLRLPPVVTRHPSRRITLSGTRSSLTSEPSAVALRERASRLSPFSSSVSVATVGRRVDAAHALPFCCVTDTRAELFFGKDEKTLDSWYSGPIICGSFAFL